MHLFRQFVIKVHSRCNLACDHCYVYEAVDQSWRDQPKAMAPETVKATAEAIARYAERHEDIDVVHVVLHGGEPLLLGHDRLHQVTQQLRAVIEPVARLELSLQSNGIRLDRAFAEQFLDSGVRVGISLDGGRQANDRHRRYRNGATSYERVVQAVTLLSEPRYKAIFGGLLCTIDIDNDPIAVFDDLAALSPPMIDVLLPHATWEHPPPQFRLGQSPYGDWLCAMFDHWFDAPPRVGIRIFQELLNALLGGASRSEAIGRSAPESLVIETDGSLEQTDALKVAYPGAARTGYTVHQHGLDDVLTGPSRFSNSSALEDLSATCQACPIVMTCGGGLYPHRYRADTGFDNPSVFCADLMRLIRHVDERLQQQLHDLPAGSAGLAAASRLAFERG